MRLAIAFVALAVCETLMLAAWAPDMVVAFAGSSGATVTLAGLVWLWLRA